MSANTIEYAQNLAANTDRGPSRSIWKDCPVLDIIENPALGMYFFDDFINGPNIPVATGSAIAQCAPPWSIYAYQGATIIDGAAEGGVITFGSDGDNEGVAFGGTAGAFRLVTTSTNALNNKLWFEARVARSSISATKGDYFVGLFDGFLTSGLPAAAVPITTTDDTLATKNLIGFHSKGAGGSGPTEWNFVYGLSGSAAVYPTNLTTLMNSVAGAVLTAGQFVKLGFLFDPNAASKQIGSASTGQTAGATKKPVVTIFVNGIPAAAFLTTDNTGGAAFPTGYMSPGFAVMNQTGSSPPTMSMDWIRCAQLALT